MKHLTPQTGSDTRGNRAAAIAPLTVDARSKLGDTLRLIERSKWLVVLCTLIAGALITLWALGRPKIYLAQTVLEYDPNPMNPLGSSVADVGSPAGHFLMTREFFETQNRILKSRAVAQSVVERLHLEAVAPFASPSGTDPAEAITQAALRLQAKVEVEPVENTRLVHVQVRDTDPERAAMLANEVADAYIDKTLSDRLGNTVEAGQWLGERLASTRTELTETETALHEFKKQHNVLSVAMEDRQNLISEELHEYNAKLSAVRARRIELEARLTRLREMRSSGEAAALSTEGDAAIASPVLQTLRDRLQQKREERASMEVKYGNAHPALREVNNEITAIQVAIRKQLDATTASANADLKEALAVEHGLVGALSGVQKEGLNLNLREIEYSRLVRDRESASKLYDLLLKRTAETDLTLLLRTTHVRLVDRALTPHAPISPNVPLHVVTGLLGGLMLGLGIAMARAQVDRRIRTPEQVEALGIDVLAVVPSFDNEARSARHPRDTRLLVNTQLTGIYVHTNPQSQIAEACRTLRTNLRFMSEDIALHTLVVTSSDPRDGKSTIASNAAITFAQSGQRTLLIDADMRRPTVHKHFGIEHTGDGFADALSGRVALSATIRTTDVDNLCVITAGHIPTNPAELLDSPRFAELRDAALTLGFDRVVYDSPPLRAVTDAAIMAPQCDGTLLIVRSGSSRHDSVVGGIRSLRSVNARLLGAVVNGVDRNDSSMYYGVGDYYGYGEQPGDAPAAIRDTASANEVTRTKQRSRTS